jgi:hypothetical protein
LICVSSLTAALTWHGAKIGDSRREIAMPTISIQLSDELLEQLAEAVELSKLGTDDFLLLAVAEKIAQTKTQDTVNAEADASYAEYLKSGESISLEEVRRHFERRVAGDHGDKFIFEKSKR